MLAIVSCSSGDEAGVPDIPEPSPVAESAIAFSGDVSEENVVTRATESLSDKGITTFRVWAFKNSGSEFSTADVVMNNYQVTWSSGSQSASNSHGWEYVNYSTDPQQSIKYWDWSSTAYRFFGYTGTDKPTGTDLMTLTIAVNATDLEHVPYYSMLWFSTGNPAVYPQKQFGQPVQLLFLQPVAYVKFLFRISDTISNFKLTNKSFGPADGTSQIATKGNFTVSYPLTGSSTTGETWATLATGYIDAFTADDLQYAVLPAQSQGDFLVSVDVNKQTKTAIVPAQFMSWSPGYLYTYIFKITDSGSVVIDGISTAFTPWSTGDATNRDIYNW